uniref:DNA cross-link repair 1A protein isoform X1 n=1 Tax=Myodes glareolus TaxID=447135 RepID=UPI0020226916|nr:DNA cross-link repair 1A protein isoform X1 [Myodes glareolus]
MLEDTLWEEDIWEYKSKRKPKPAHPNNCSQNIPESVGKATDGKDQSKRKGNKRRTTDDKDNQKALGVCLEETDCPISVGGSQNSSAGDEVPQSESKETTPRKSRRTHKKKQVSPRVRPVYDGYCPNCQMPFSSLLGQTPQWHVFECLDSPPISDTECPEGLWCTCTIPSHYKKYTHLLLAQSRASNEPLSSPSQVSAPLSSQSHTLAGHFPAAKPDPSCNPEEKWPVHLNTDNLRKVLEDSSLMVQCLKTSQLPAETDRKIPPSSGPRVSLAPQRAGFVKKDKLVGDGLPLSADALTGKSSSQSTRAPSPEDDSSSCEISYSPLQSDEETYDLNGELGDSQQELFSTQSSKDSCLEEDGSAIFETLLDPFPKEREGACPLAKSLLTQAEFSGFCEGSAISGSFQLPPQGAPPHTDTGFLLFSPSLTAGRAASDDQTTKAKPGEPRKFHSLGSSHQTQKSETSAVGSQFSLPFRTSAMSKPPEKEGGEHLPLHPTQSQIRGLGSKGLGATIASSACTCRKGEKPSSAPLAKSLSTLPSSPKCNASQPSKKAMKQMDIGVFFGLPPKKQAEPSPRASAVGGPNASPGVSPKDKRRQPRKRKAENSLSDLELDSGNLNESQHSTELSQERTQRQRKRHKKSSSSWEGAPQRPEVGAVSLNQSKAFVSRTLGRLQRGSRGISESSGAREARRTCPFYKRIPGTGFTVDAFQYGEVEGCTAYFLTHFHSDHYAGLSKDSTFPIYCSEITGNLLKKKLRVQEQYVHQLPMDTECVVDGVKVVLLDANHCPGAAMILFRLANGAVTLHTGDFRANPSMERSLLAGHRVHTLYLDTTYCSPEFTFPSQQEVIQFAINTAFEAVTLNPRTLVVCGTYCIGKEKVFLAVADVLGSKVGMSQEKYKTLQSLNIPEVSSLITTDMSSSSVHLLPMMQINFKGLQSHLKRCGGKFDQILAFRPTGWTHSNNITSIADITPQTKGNISIYGIPYSEHSSYLEMKRFVQWLKPQKIIPTVNVGTFKSRNAMEKCFKEWRLEAGY